MTNKEWLGTVSSNIWMDVYGWLVYTYGKRYDNSYIAIKEWLDEEHTPIEVWDIQNQKFITPWG